MKLTLKGIIPPVVTPLVDNSTLDVKGLEKFKEFQVFQKYVSDGKIEVSFDQPEESHLNWR